MQPARLSPADRGTVSVEISWSAAEAEGWCRSFAACEASSYHSAASRPQQTSHVIAVRVAIVTTTRLGSHLPSSIFYVMIISLPLNSYTITIDDE